MSRKHAPQPSTVSAIQGLEVPEYVRAFDWMTLYDDADKDASDNNDSQRPLLKAGVTRSSALAPVKHISHFAKHTPGGERYVFGRTAAKAAENVALLYPMTARVSRETIAVIELVSRTPAFSSAVAMTMSAILRAPPEFKLAEGKRWNPLVEKTFELAYATMIRQALPMLWKYGFVAVLLVTDPASKLILPRVADLTLFDVHVYTNSKTGQIMLKLYNLMSQSYVSEVAFYMSDSVDVFGRIRSFASAVTPTYLIVNAQTQAALLAEKHNQTQEVYLQPVRESGGKPEKIQETGLQLLARYSRAGGPQPAGDYGGESMRGRMMTDDLAGYSGHGMQQDQSGTDGLLTTRRVTVSGDARVLHVVAPGYEVARAPERRAPSDVTPLHDLFDSEVARTIGFDAAQFSSNQRSAQGRPEDIRRRQLGVFVSARAAMEQLCHTVWEESYGSVHLSATHAELVRRKTQEVILRQANAVGVVQRNKAHDLGVIDGDIPLSAEELAAKIQITEAEYQRIVDETSVEIVLCDVHNLDMETIVKLMEAGAITREDGLYLMREMCGLGSYYESGKPFIVDPVEAKTMALKERVETQAMALHERTTRVAELTAANAVAQTSGTKRKTDDTRRERTQQGKADSDTSDSDTEDGQDDTPKQRDGAADTKARGQPAKKKARKDASEKTSSRPAQPTATESAKTGDVPKRPATRSRK